MGRDLKIFYLLLLVPSVAFGKACLSDGSVCLEVAPTRNGIIEISAASQKPCSLTITAELRLLSPTSPKEAFTFSLNKRERKTIFVKAPAGDQGDSDLAYVFHAQCGILGTIPENFAYEIPFAPGESVRVSQGFHGNRSHFDETNTFALDFDVPEGNPVHAARSGVVVEVVTKFTNGGPNQDANQVNVIRVQHTDHSVAEYAHLKQKGALVKVGQFVTMGEPLGYSGNTGRSTGPHLHFAVHVPVDGKARRSVRVRFKGENNSIRELEEGKKYSSTLKAGPYRLHSSM